jgi:hypothetical protein
VVTTAVGHELPENVAMRPKFLAYVSAGPSGSVIDVTARKQYRYSPGF